jgi:hypothetical protein
MTIAPARTDYSRTWSARRFSTATAETVGSAQTIAEALLQRLVERTTTAGGLDRETLRNLDSSAWRPSD